MVPDAARQRVRQRIENGILPRDRPIELWHAPGFGQTCDGCGVAITTTEWMCLMCAEPAARLSASHAARCVVCQGVRSHPVPVTLVGLCSIPVVSGEGVRRSRGPPSEVGRVGQNTCYSNDLICPYQQRLRNCEPEVLGRRQIDNQLEFGGRSMGRSARRIPRSNIITGSGAVASCLLSSHRDH
jgi:hypothetical protein